MSINMATPAETQDLRLLAALLSAALDETGRVGAPDEVTDKLLDALRWVADTDTSLFIEPPQH